MNSISLRLAIVTVVLSNLPATSFQNTLGISLAAKGVYNNKYSCLLNKERLNVFFFVVFGTVRVPVPVGPQKQGTTVKLSFSKHPSLNYRYMIIMR